VIVPAFDASVFIRQTLDSVLQQSYRNIEVIVVDDGSQDRTFQILQSLAKEESRLKILQQPNQGAAAARNLAIENSNGEYIAPVDADDLWENRKIEKQVDCMSGGGSSLGLVYTWWISIDESGLPFYNSPKWEFKGSVEKTLTAINFIGNASVPMFRRSCLEEVGGYNPDWRKQGAQGCEDWDLSLRIAEKYLVRLVPEYLVKYRSVKGSMAGNLATMEKSHQLLIQSVKQRHPDIDDKVLRTSTSNFYFYLSAVNYRSGNYKGALNWACKALFSKKAQPFSIWTLRLLFIYMPKIARSLIATLVRSRSTSSFQTSNTTPSETKWLER
jgi:glycosyltransferase involved in cell wall biosynthesis